MKTFAIIALFLVSLTACKKRGCEGETEKYQSTARINSLIHPACACCGYYINVDGKDYTFMELPATAGFELENQVMPLDLLINWHRDSTSDCGSQTGDRIVIDAVKRK